MIDVAAGQYHTCVLRSGGQVLCAGANAEGQLGRGAGDMSDVTRFAPVVGLTDVVKLGPGWNHTCAIHRDGTVSCWGRDLEGQVTGVLGGLEESPVAITLPARALEIVGGLQHTCARLEDRRVYCWGANGSGQLGNGSTAPVSGLQLVTGLPTRVDP
ncbi:MAG: hypothetical protein H6721_20855 [Sandaracinus sp.]|nr:hypothetical protein [Sandaracinus sp.]